MPGREEYLDSEKYQLKERDWDAPGNIKDWITRLNQIRKENRALQFYDNLRFYRADNEAILFYGKMTAGAGQYHPGRGESRSASASRIRYVHVPLDRFRAMEGDAYQVHDLLSDARYIWHGRAQLRRARSGDSAGPHFSASGAGSKWRSVLQSCSVLLNNARISSSNCSILPDEHLHH